MKIKKFRFNQFQRAFHVLMPIGGWIGILLYYFHRPISFSLIGLILYLVFHTLLLIIFILVLELILHRTGEQSSSRSHLRVFNLGFYKHEINRHDPLKADLETRGMFLRELKRVLRKQFPKLKYLSSEKYDYTKINLGTDFRKFSFSNKRDKEKNIVRELVSSSESRHRLKYGDPRIEEFLKKHQLKGKRSLKRFWLGLSILFIFSIPAEDGLFLAPPALIGINGVTAIIFSLLFGFAHFWKYSVINCLRLALWEVFVILIFLPNYGLLTCVIGHVLCDLILSIPVIFKAIYEMKQSS